MRAAELVILTLGAVAAAATAHAQDTSGRAGISIRVVTPPPPPADTPLIHRVPPGAPLLLELTKKSRRISPETLLVYSAMAGGPWPYTGEPLDSTFESLFEPFYPSLAFPHEEPQLFASNRFVLDPQHIGFLLRVPGMYEPSQIDLWVYDAHQMRFAPPIRLAESWGDEGCGYDLQSLLIRTEDRRLNLILHQNTGCSDMETGKVTSNVDSLWTRAWTSPAFTAARVSSDSMLFRLLEAQMRRLPR